MRWRRRAIEEQRVRTLLEGLGDSIEPPTEHELRAAARAATAEPRQPQAKPARPWRPLRLRWALVGAATILLATGLGFGFGTWLTPTGSAGRDVLGLGFLPAEGWTVMQSGSAETARAAATNVPFASTDRPGGEPVATLQSLPPSGVVVVATLTTRGDPAADAGFPVRSLPLRVAAPDRQTLTQYRLRAGVGGYNVDARIYFGSRPSPELLGAANAQMERLVVAPDQVTIAVRPTINPRTAYGSVANGKAGEKVTVQFRQCGLYPIQFRDVAEITTNEGGGWSLDLGVEANGTFRAVAGGSVSNEVRVLKRADVRLSPTRFGRYEAYVVARSSFWHRRVLIQRFDRQRRRWTTLKTLVLQHASAAPGSLYVWSSTDKFAVKLPRGTNIRAVLPRDQARPCHIAGYSNLLRR
jgi:hypothetical protein